MSEIYFRVNDKNLYLDFMLEELNGMPFFYVCKDDKNEKYLVLCSDFENEEYFIVKISLHDLRDMLYGTIDIRSAFSDKPCWKINCLGNTYLDDLISEYEGIPVEFLPDQDEKYLLLDKDHLEYAQRIMNEYETMLKSINMISYQWSEIEEHEWIDNDLLLITTSMDEEFFYDYNENQDYLLEKEKLIMAA